MEAMKSMMIAASGMRAQSERMRIVAENIANANSLGQGPETEPYRRRIPVFKSELDRANGVSLVSFSRTIPDMSDFGKRHDPAHPAADQNGYVKIPNVNTLIEMIDMQTAQRSFEANLNVIETARNMMARTVDLLR